ncbi:hypothetical protein RM717_24335 [Streptomyces griseus]|uniref:Uncharacterized protein n=2 Tax=Streptomycetaceae TaxID=2062 RepID=A0ABU2W958_9ACTN|nr:hypothetical protein [Streptomyces griseus]ARF72562.1 hypothetical protein B7C62_09975 [Kitasatospora albolonga]MDT0493632.1 hypothetical protein [Streptomyces griseus]
MPGFSAVPVALALCAGLLAGPSAAPEPPADCRAGPADCYGLYTYGYSLGLHPFTGAHAVRAQLTDHFWLFPVSGGCAGRVRAGDRCELLGGNPVEVEHIGDDVLQIASLPGHQLGSGMHIRFSFSRTLGFHTLTVRAWQDRPTDCTGAAFCNTANSAFAWGTWWVLARTLRLSAYAA